MNIQNIIFDLGGVVVEWNPARIIAKFTQDAALGAKLKQGIFDHPDWVEKDRGILSEAEINQRFSSRTGLSGLEIDSFMGIILDTILLKTETLLLMDELQLQGYRLLCLSNMPVDHYDHLTQVYDFWNKFDGIVISGMVKMVKPELQIYNHLLEKYRLEASTCLFIDDSPKNIQAAQSLGIQGIVFRDIDACRRELEEIGILNS